MVASSETTPTTEKIRVVKPAGYQTVQTPIPTSSAAGPNPAFYATEDAAPGSPRPAVRSVESAPDADSSGILNAIEAVYRVASARRAWLLSELKALDAALAPFAGASVAKPATSGPSDDGALVSALLQFAERNKGDSA